jgi:hypothetical protein
MLRELGGIGCFSHTRINTWDIQFKPIYDKWTLSISVFA